MLSQTSGGINNPSTTNSTELIEGGEYTLDGQHPLRAAWNPNTQYWALCIYSAQRERWRPAYFLLGKIILAYVAHDGNQSILKPSGYTIEDLQPFEDATLDPDIWSDVLAYADTHLPR